MAAIAVAIAKHDAVSYMSWHFLFNQLFLSQGSSVAVLSLSVRCF